MEIYNSSKGELIREKDLCTNLIIIAERKLLRITEHGC